MRADKSQRDLSVDLTRRSTGRKLEVVRVNLPQSFVYFFDKFNGLSGKRARHSRFGIVADKLNCSYTTNRSNPDVRYFVKTFDIIQRFI